MLRNYLLVTFRNLFKNGFYSFINISGLAIGITCSILIVLWVADETSFDKFRPKADRLYQVWVNAHFDGKVNSWTSLPLPTHEALKTADANIVRALVTDWGGEHLLTVSEEKRMNKKGHYVSEEFLEMFQFPMIAGNPETVLDDPTNIVITESTAKSLFGNEDPMGKMIRVDNGKELKVAGLLKDVPPNSSFQFDYLIPYKFWRQESQWVRNNETNWGNYSFPIFVELNDPKNAESVEKNIKNMLAAHGEDTEIKHEFFLYPLLRWRLYSNFENGIEKGGLSDYVQLFTIIAVFIIVIACINFMNLSTARSAGRAKEVGLRKTLGSLRGQMIYQFLSESTIYSLVAVVLSIISCYFLLPYFNTLSGKTLGMGLFVTPGFILGLIGLILFVGLVAGSYPAFYLTSFSAVEVLKGKVRAGMKSKGVRSFLVIFQFALSIFLIIFTAVVYQQIQFMQAKNIGIDKNNILVVKNTGRLGNNKEAFRNALSQESGVVKISYTNNTFPGPNNTTVFKEAASEQDHIMGVYSADFDHMDVMKFELKEGRYFSRDFPSDSSAIILNEAAVREFNFSDPLNAEVLYNDGGSAFKKYKIIGVMKNFNFESFKAQVRPLAVLLTKDSRNVMIRYEGSPSEIVAKTENLWKAQANNEPFEYEFLDQSFDQLFRAEQRMGTIFSVFAGLAIFVACLGLFALSAFTSEQRTKEIGIRKAMGATSLSLTLLLSKEFTKLVIIAFVPAAALGWYVSHTWLQDFAYRVEINPVLLLLSGVAAIVIAWLTVSFQSIKAAVSNPVNSLRYE